MKRFFDIIASIAGIFLLSPLLVLVGGLIGITSGLPVIFRQLRVGKDGQDFYILKFRTMRTIDGASIGTFDLGKQCRVTQLGKVLRRTKIDEFPQLWNVLKGDMSIVGPRPEVRRWVDEYPAEWSIVHRVRPGITDPAAIAFRREEELLRAQADPESFYRMEILPAKFAAYREYVNKNTFTGDLRIIIETFYVVLFK